MTLKELAVQYRTQARVLQDRISLLEKEGAKEGGQTAQLAYRLQCLTEMWREARDIAVLLERYYERGYRRNGRYSL